MNEMLMEDETMEDLQLNGMRLIQKKNAFRFGMDSVLLAHFSDIGPYETVADFGTGNGVLIFLLRGREKGSRYYAVDIQHEACDLVKRNAVLNHMEDRIEVIHADAIDAAKNIIPCSVDAVVCNPPYGEPEACIHSPYGNKAAARNQESDTIDHLLKGAFTILRGKGHIFLVYPAAQMLSLMKRLQNHHLEPKRFQLVYPHLDRPANLVLVEAVKDAKPKLHPMAPIIVYEQDGSLTNKLKSVYHIQRTD